MIFLFLWVCLEYASLFCIFAFKIQMITDAERNYNFG